MLDKHFFTPDQLAPFRKRAATVLTDACLAGSCTCGQATRFVDDTDPKRVDLAKLGCENGEAEACYVLGTLHEGGKGVPKDEALARRLYELACPAKVPIETTSSPRRGEYSQRACARMAAYYDEGAIPPKDDARAFFYLAKGCPVPGLALDHETCVKVARYWLTTARNSGRNGEEAGLHLRRKDECRRPSVGTLCDTEMKALTK
jgi:TPR repeat protein